MSSDDEFGPDTEAIKRWLAKREQYASEDRARPAGRHRSEPAASAEEDLPAAPPARPAQSAALPAPVPFADAHDAARSVLAGLDLSPAGATPVAEPGLAAEPTPVAEPATRAEPAATPEPPVEAAPDQHAAAEPAPPRGPALPDSSVPTGRGRATAELMRPEHVPDPEDAAGHQAASTNVVFEPRTGVRRAMTAILVVALVALAAATVFAVRQPSTATIGVAGTLAVLCLVEWAIRAGTTATQVSITRGQLELRHGGRFEVVDLTSPYTPIAVLGTPGRRGWRVLLERIGEPLVEIDSSLVDPHHFTQALRRIRPDLWEAQSQQSEQTGAPAVSDLRSAPAR